jgi:hypothetical protein
VSTAENGVALRFVKIRHHGLVAARFAVRTACFLFATEGLGLCWSCELPPISLAVNNYGCAQCRLDGKSSRAAIGKEPIGTQPSFDRNGAAAVR